MPLIAKEIKPPLELKKLHTPSLFRPLPAPQQVTPRAWVHLPSRVYLVSLLLLASACAAQSPLPLIATDADSVASEPLPDAPTAQNSTLPQTQLQTQPDTQLQIPPATQPSSPIQPLPRASDADINLPATVRGVVTDRDGAVYQGVRIALTQPAPIALPERSTTSDVDGQFQFAAVPVGVFTLTVSSEGFATQVVNGVLKPGEVYETPPIVLPFAGTMSEIRVTASRQEIAQAQVKQEEQQRVLGIIPNFYVSYAPNAPPLTRRQKFDLAWRSSIDPVSFLSAGFFAGIEQVNGDFKGYGEGAAGYAKRYGANYGDDFISTMIGGAILPSLWKQDPRYFYKGTGSTRSRILYAIANSVICKGDNGHWQPNYSAIVGGLAAAGISNLYYPASDRNGASLTFENTLIGTGGTAIGNLFQEFLVKKLTPRLPKYTQSRP